MPGQVDHAPLQVYAGAQSLLRDRACPGWPLQGRLAAHLVGATASMAAASARSAFSCEMLRSSRYTPVISRLRAPTQVLSPLVRCRTDAEG